MHKRLVLYLLLLIFTFYTNVNSAESEGMPQLKAIKQPGHHLEQIISSNQDHVL